MRLSFEKLNIGDLMWMCFENGNRLGCNFRLVRVLLRMIWVVILVIDILVIFDRKGMVCEVFGLVLMM